MENKQMLNKWIEAKKKIESKEVDLKKSILEATKNVYGWEHNKVIDIYTDGSISDVKESNTTVFCKDHSYGVYCVDCYPLIRIYGWNVFDYIGINSEDDKNEQLEGSVWDCEGKEWIKEEECRDNMINEMDFENELDEAIEEINMIIKSYKDQIEQEEQEV